jgi:signal transduction histidine kinase
MGITNEQNDCPEEDCRPSRRARLRDGLIDSAAVSFAATVGTLTYIDAIQAETPSAVAVVLIMVFGVASILSLYVRRQWPIGIAVLTMVVATFSPVASGASLVGLFTVASRRPWKVSSLIAGLSLFVSTPVYYLLFESESALWVNMSLTALVIAVALAWGLFVGARRQLIASLRERARQAEADRDLRLAQAREQERTRIAREMHDVLAHRISLVALNAGALEFRPDASPEEVREAAAVVRSNAHQALEELRDVISVLRDEDSPEDGPAEPPQPTLTDVRSLVEELRQSGVRIEFDESVEEAAGVPESTGRTAYRVVQEGLTNARKHAPGADARVAVAGSAEEGLTVEISNRRSPAGPAARGAIPGSGTGLIGLAERVELAGGDLSHGTRPDGRFTLKAWLPWNN